ncbi:gamma-mobile-trio integrase GmtZ [Pseudomonas sp. HLT2-19-2]
MVKGKREEYNGRSEDYEFTWLAERGLKWNVWREWMSGWIASNKSGVHHRMRALIWFTNVYLPLIPNPSDAHGLFRLSTQTSLPDLQTALEQTMSVATATGIRNHIYSFFEWILDGYYTEPDDRGVNLRTVANPFSKGKYVSGHVSESVYTPLPYAYIREAREILCPNDRGSFSDWKWAHLQSGQMRSNGREAGRGGDWFAVDPSVIDKDDPDCVWRKRTVIRYNGKNNADLDIYEIWAPVRSVALLLKLHLPLRTYQVRFLDSGEADTWRYVNGSWVINDQHKFALGSERNPWGRGVFCRVHNKDTGEHMTGLHVNTNKTADKNKEERERGYTIPWQHEDVLYWLEKLRNWQEKYNPIDRPQPCIDLDSSTHFGFNKSEDQRREMGSICFLFRDAAHLQGGTSKPITRSVMDTLWYKLLSALQERVHDRGQTLSDGSKFEFVQDYPDEYEGKFAPKKVATHFPLHSLRVSLLTCYAMEGSVPMPVLSKLIAGHSRLLMTLYYVKPSISQVSNAMSEASKKVDAAQHESLRVFLKDASLRQITSKTVYQDQASIEMAMANRNPLGWEHRHIGLCLVGGNTVKSDEKSTVGGCWNGGELFGQRGVPIYLAVPHGPENCIRCRWFITDARYLDPLRAHFNNLSYKASLAAKLAVEHEQIRDELLEERYFAQEEGKPFTRQAELQQAERRYEKQITEADEYAKDLVACFQIIGRLVSIEEDREEGDESTKLVAVGSMEDVRHPISFIETDSEMLQLAQICEDAEIYPDLMDDIRKSPAVEKRSRALNRVLMSQGYVPIFMNMDDRMQLIAGNAMMRAMASKANPTNQLEGFRMASGVLEAGQNLGLLPSGISALEHTFEAPVIKLVDLLSISPSHQGVL